MFKDSKDFRENYKPFNDQIFIKLKSTGGGSDRFGNCEICHRRAEVVYHLSARRKGRQPNQLLEIGGFPSFGHEQCLLDNFADIQSLIQNT